MKDMNSGSGLNRKMQSNDGNDVEMLDALMKKLIDSKKLTKKQLLQKLMSVSEKDEQSNIEESPAAENILDGESDEDVAQQRSTAHESSHRN